MVKSLKMFHIYFKTCDIIMYTKDKHRNTYKMLIRLNVYMTKLSKKNEDGVNIVGRNIKATDKTQLIESL